VRERKRERERERNKRDVLTMCIRGRERVEKENTI